MPVGKPYPSKSPAGVMDNTHRAARAIKVASLKAVNNSLKTKGKITK